MPGPFRSVRLLLLLPAIALMATPGSAKSAGSTTLVYSAPVNVGPLNPHLYSPSQMFGQAMVYEPLVRYGAGGKIVPWLAEKWSISADGREVLFHLRKGVVFSDGTPFDAAAVKNNHDAVLANRKRHDWLEAIAQIRETRVVDNLTVKLILKDPYYPILHDLALVRPIRYLSPSAFPPSGNTADGLKAPIGTGPWKLVETKLGEYDRFERNERYWGKKPAVDYLLVKVIPDSNARAVAFETGDLDLIYGDQISLDTFKRFQKTGANTARISGPLATRTLAINSYRGATAELAVRKAIQHAVDKDALVKGVFLETELKADTLFPKNLSYCDLGLVPYKYDPTAAEKILDQAGWKRDSVQGFRSKNGTSLRLDLCFQGTNAVMKAVAEVLQANLQKVGIQVDLIGEEDDSYYRRQKEGTFNLIFNDTWGPPYEPHSFISSWRVSSHADYQAQRGLVNKAELDAQIGKVLVSRDEKERQQLYRFILSTVHEQAVYLPISYTTVLMVHGKSLSGAGFGSTLYEIPFEAMVKR